MAPGRSKRGGAKGANTTSELGLGDLVLAKVKGFPPWPAKISRPEDWERIPDPKKYFVQFFGTAEIAFVAPVDIKEFTSESKSKLSTRCQGKTVKYFAQAVKEICAEFEALQQKNTSGLGDDSDRSTIGCEAPSVDGMVDKAAEAELSNGIATNASRGEIEFKGSVLKHCSHRQGDMYCQDTKPIISRLSSDSFSPGISSQKNNKFSDGANIPKAEAVSASSPYNVSCPKEEVSCDCNTESNFTCFKHSGVPACTEGLNASGGSRFSDADSSSGLLSVKKDNISQMVSVDAMHPDTVQKELTNGLKSKKMMTGFKGKTQGALQVHKISSSAVQTSLTCDSSAGHLDLPESGEHSKDGIRREIASGDVMKKSSPDVNSNLGVYSGKKANKFLKDKKRTEPGDELQKNVKTISEEPAKAELSCRKMKAQPGHGKHTLITYEVSHFAKRSKCADATDDGTRGSLQTNRKSDSRSPNVVDSRADNAEVKKSAKQVKVENRLASKAQTASLGPKIPSEEDVLAPTKHHRQALEGSLAYEGKAGKHSAAFRPDLSCSDNVKSPVAQLNAKRRAVRLYDDDDDDGEPKTPIHGGFAKKARADSRALDSIKNIDKCSERSIHGRSSVRDSGGRENGSSKELVASAKLLIESSSPILQQTAEKRPKQVSPRKFGSDKVSSKEAKPDLLSPNKSPLPVAATPVVEQHKANKSSANLSSNVSQKKAQAAPREMQKSTPKSSLRINDSSLVAGDLMETKSVYGERIEALRDDKRISMTDTKVSDSVMPMKHLIAAAQAKRRQAHSQNVSHVNATSNFAPSTEVIGRSLSPAPVVQHFSSSSSIMIEPDSQGYYTHSSFASPSAQGRQFSSNNQLDTEEIEERRVSSGHWPAGGSLSGGTEAAVARDAFEGMIETLSRTKESIGRATRLAIDCAKYGIANEVVELLIRKLESEPSFHRKVDLFFLVDSITQCSHSHKGIAASSYIPTVQSALSRLLEAAAPPGAGAHENRRQCLKVLRLWLERKIFPESLLRRFMDDIGVSNDDTASGSFLKRPSRAERSVDDPIREMEGMLVDEYGSNATYQLPGFLPTRIFEEEEEYEEEDAPKSSSKESGDRLSLEPTPVTGDTEAWTVTPNDRQHHILEDVDGELEMEDVPGHLKHDKPFTNGVSEIAPVTQGSDGIFEADSDNYTDLSPLPEGSPPLPLDSPPPTPPLPASPPPPSPPPSPSPPPPPPPPSQLHVLPPAPAVLPLSLPPQFSVASQQLQALQASTSSPKLTLQPSVPHESCRPPSGHQLVQIAPNTLNGAHIDTVIRSEMFLQQLPGFTPAGACTSREPSGYISSGPLEYGHNDKYINPQVSQTNPQFQHGTALFSQRPFHPAPPSQTPSSHFSYPKSSVQQHPQQPCPLPYLISNLPDGSKRYVADEQWRVPSQDFNTGHQHGVRISGGRTSCSGTPFAQEGYYRPLLERPPTNNVNFQSPASGTLPPGPPTRGHGVSQMVPSRPDVSSFNCWRPA